jgi:predicted RecB family nuclease
MFLLEGRLVWTASDLSVAVECEYALLRTVDYRLGWAEKLNLPDDPMQEQLARLGDRHEQRLLESRQACGSVIQLPRVPTPYSAAALKAADEATRAAFSQRASVVYQAGFFDAEFHGYADFVELAEDGWIVCDAKLARSARPKALLQLGAYVEQLRRMQLPLSTKVSLLLGSGERADFRTDDVLPVFRERRERLRRMLQEHRIGGVSVQWGDERYATCGRCDECEAAAEKANDLLLVAGLNVAQRRKLRAAGFTTIGDLAAAGAGPDGMAPTTFEKLKAQAKLQWTQMQAGPEAPVTAELTRTAAQTLALLPAPSEGDLFFDFEGDPLYDEGDPSRGGLEYLWGIMDAAERYEFEPHWAHTWKDERAAFVAFIEFIAARRAQYPDMHIYHYAPYETTALKRMMMTYQVKRDEFDTLLREQVFVDLYATVRGAIRISAPSYSIKKLEPLYMGDQLRNEDGVTSGGASILAYRQYRELRVADPAAARKHLDDLEDYNRYDCLSTLRLRAWLLARAKDAAVFDQIKPRSKAVESEAAPKAGPQVAQARQDLTQRLLGLAGDGTPATRTAEQQGFAMLASALNYYQLECNAFWWDHYGRLQNPIEDWADTREVFVVDRAAVEQDWVQPGGRARNHRRTLRLVGDWAPGSQEGRSGFAVYRNPNPPGVFGPKAALYGAGGAEDIEESADDPRAVRLTESRKPTETFSELPIALTPSKPPDTDNLEAAIEQLAAEAAAAGVLPNRGIFDLLLRRAPRVGSAGLPRASGLVPDIVAALIGMQNSYLAIQGPPGTGKTHTGSRVIRELVEKHHWRVGVVAQSHAVVENMLAGAVASGLDGSLIGKSNPRATDRRWTEIKDDVRSRARFLQEHQSTGCVLGGTAWTFSHPDLLAAGQLDLLVVDEAGQFSLATTLAASIAARRLLLLGDPQQLPQVSQATHADAVDESALGWLMQGHDTLPAEFGYFLADSYRMHPELCSKVAALSYERRLKTAANAAKRDLEGVAPGLGVVQVEHTGNRTESIEEARAVVEQIQALVGKRWQESQDVPARPLEGKDFLVVAPYNAQVARIRDELDAAGLSAVKVGTVDKFQGQEAPVAFISMTASSHGDVPRGMAFLLNRNRVNVAVSRAKWRAVIVRSAALTAYMPSSGAELLELGAFIGLCGENP